MLNTHNDSFKTNKQLEYPLKTCFIKPITNDIKARGTPKSILRNFCSFWTEPCICGNKPRTFGIDPQPPISSREILSKIINTAPTSARSNYWSKDQDNTDSAKLQSKTVADNTEKDDPNQVAQIMPLSDIKITHKSPQVIGDIKPLNSNSDDIHISLAEKLSSKLEQAQERILLLEREKLLLEQSLSAMKMEMEESMTCIQQSEAVMDTQHNYSTAVLSSIIDFCCSLSTPNKHPEVRHAVRTFALDLFQLLINHNAPNNHIAELIALNGILAETSYVDALNTPKQLTSNATKAVFKSSKPLSSIRPL